ncbi:hypothetical protein ACFSNO_29260 [Streptomyces cirratus]
MAVYVTLKAVADSRDPHAKGLDLPGMAAFTAGAGVVTYALIRAGENGWTSAATLGLLGVGVAAFAVFVLVELRTARPMLDLSLFRSSTFVGVMAAALLLSGAAFSYLMYVSLWLQSVEGMSPVGAGRGVGAAAEPGLVPRLGAGRPAPARGPAAADHRRRAGAHRAGALLQAWMLDAGDGWQALVPGLVMTGAGVGAAIPSLAATVMGAVAPARAGMAGGALNTARQLGMAFGIAVLGSLFHAGLADGLGGSGQARGTAEALASGGGRAIAGRRPGGQGLGGGGLRERAAGDLRGLGGDGSAGCPRRRPADPLDGASGGAPQAGARPADAAAVPERV